MQIRSSAAEWRCQIAYCGRDGVLGAKGAIPNDIVRTPHPTTPFPWEALSGVHH